ncbi:MAG: sigma-54-dependent Fis family transcriptional regulator [Acidobacteria bacterium]|nr:MAG: sigma-54-dependent Fis family transcriptional regulator [Acidobacteriota bacterium]REK11705.1 MAG: sigma-54-dependent Fis family transcriptional regulator [Acidobacteriota bacterium]
MNANVPVIVIDDETGSRESMAIAVEKAGLPVRTFDDAAKALDFVRREPAVRLAICDLRMPGMDGLGFLEAVRQQEIDLAVILVTGYGSIESAVEAIRVGADDYLTKPVDLYELRQRVTNLLENRQLKEENTNLRQMLDKRYGFDAIVGRSGPMERLFEQMRVVAPTQSSVLIVGESGTGKELVAKALHQGSPRSKERFLAINCGAIPNDILESELFGHEKGAFTGAVSRKIGKFELADRGTLFLDEISELYPELQVKLLRVLEERQVMRVGGSELIDLDFRLLAATNRDMEKAVAEGRFREDLYYRLKVVTLEIPPLRERISDLPLMAEHFLAEFAAREGRQKMKLTPDALAALSSYPWPGNVRELRNVLESVAVFQTKAEIDLEALPHEIQSAKPASPITVDAPRGSARVRSMAEIERHAILDTLEHTGGRRAEAAELLGIGLRTLQRKLKDYREQGYFSD